MKQFLTAVEVGTGGARPLPGEYYTSSDIFSQERERIFRRHWLCVGREAEISRVGDFFVRDIGDESLIALRGESSVRVFHNLCRHRGSLLCDSRKGTFPRTLQCPYHAWTYDLAGRLVGAPTFDEDAEFDKADYPLISIPSAVWEGFVFVALDPPAVSFETYYAPIWSRFETYGLPKLHSSRRIEYLVEANWKLIFENYSECLHCPTVHPALVKLSPADSGENDYTSGPFLGGFMTMTREGGGMSHSGRSCGPTLGNLRPEDLGRVYYYTIFPNMLLSLHPDYVMFHTIWPESPRRTRVECEWLFHPDALWSGTYDPEDAIGFWDMTNRQDWHICELSQRGVSSRAYTPGPFSPRESISAAFDREVLRVLGH